MEAKLAEEILEFICDELGGDWLITGGSLVRLKFDATRGTEDIDLVRIRHPELTDEASRNKLFRWLIDRGLGPEWVNTAVEPFVREVEHWENEIVLLRNGRQGGLYRPNFTLFTYLKLRRGTDIDLQDIRSARAHCPEGFDEKKFLKWADSKLRSRFQQLRTKLGI